MSTRTRETASQELDEVLRELGSDARTGLTGAEAARRLAEEGPNELRAAPPVPRWRRFVAQFQDPLIYLLLAAVVIATAAWWVEGRAGWPVDPVVIAVVVLLNAVLGYSQEARAEQAVAALQRMTQVRATVVRDGRVVQVAVREVVRGDLLVLGEGDSVAADGRVVEANALRVAEAALTGESTAVSKGPGTLPTDLPVADRTNSVFRGTAVTQGTGRAVVTATAMDTEMGRIAALLESTVREPTPLEREIAFIGRFLGSAVVVIALVVMGTVWAVSGVDSAEDAVTVLLLGVSLAVAAVPEGLPAVLSVVLSIGVQRMARRDAIVKNLSSVETLGSASVICSDKTGTLTSNEMTLQRVVTASGTVEVTVSATAPRGRCAGARRCSALERRRQRDRHRAGGPSRGGCRRARGRCALLQQRAARGGRRVVGPRGPDRGRLPRRRAQDGSDRAPPPTVHPHRRGALHLRAQAHVDRAARPRARRRPGPGHQGCAGRGPAAVHPLPQGYADAPARRGDPRPGARGRRGALRPGDAHHRGGLPPSGRGPDR